MSTKTATSTDFSDVIHVEARTWGRDYTAPTARPWTPGAGLADDDLSGHGDLTNAEFERMLKQARSNGQVMEMRTQVGRQRAQSGRVALGGGIYASNSDREREVRAYNKKLRDEERAQFTKAYPNGCGCIRCEAKRAR
jgi:hypothetical protein